MYKEAQTELAIFGAASVRSFYRHRRVLVVGADGFLGVNCIHALQALRADITILTRRPAPRVVGFKGRVVHGDLREQELVREAVEGQSVVFDFAGTSGAVGSNRAPDNNVIDECYPQLCLFRACSEAASSPLVIFCSSRLVYGRPQYLPVDEEHALSPQSIYAAHKITAENYLKVFGNTHGLRYCIFRLSNPYGPHQPVEARGYGIINQFIHAAAHRRCIEIYGDGSQRRDYVYVGDVLNALLLSAMTETCRNEIFNLGGAEAISLRAAAEELARLSDGSLIRFVPWPQDDRAVETGDYCTDSTKINSHMNLPPRLSFAEGAALTFNFYRGAMARPGAAGKVLEMV